MHLPYIPKRFYKTPQAVLGYEWDWSRWLTKRGESIASVEITATGLAVGAITHALGIVTVSLGGGVVGQKYTVTCKITTTGVKPAGVLVNTRSIVVAVKDM